MTRTFSTHWLLAAALAVAGCGGSGNGGTTTAAEQNQGDQDSGSETPIGANEQLEDFRLLTMDMAAEHICRRVEGQLMSVGGGDEEEPAEGRMWIRGCEARMEDEELAIDVDAVVWSWVDRGDSAVGADFEVSQYVGLDADIQFRVIPHLRYDRERHHAFVWLEPVSDPRVSVRTMGNVEAEAQGLWSEFVGFAADVFGASPSERAETRVREQGDARLEQRVDDGVSFGMDLCTSQTEADLGRMSEMPQTETPDRGAPGDSTNVRVRVMGIDAAGPFTSGEVAVEVTDGSPLRARLVCAEDGHRMIEAFLDGGLDAVPDVEAVAEERIEEGDTVTLQPEGAPGCDLILIATVVEGGEAASTFSYAEQPEEPMALIGGCSDRQEEEQHQAARDDASGQSASEGSEARAER